MTACILEPRLLTDCRPLWAAVQVTPDWVSPALVPLILAVLCAALALGRSRS